MSIDIMVIQNYIYRFRIVLIYCCAIILIELFYMPSNNYHVGPHFRRISAMLQKIMDPSPSFSKVVNSLDTEISNCEKKSETATLPQLRHWKCICVDKFPYGREYI